MAEPKKESRAIQQFKSFMSLEYGMSAEWFDEVVHAIKQGNNPEMENYILGSKVRDKIQNRLRGVNQDLDDVDWYIGFVTRLFFDDDGARIQQQNVGTSKSQAENQDEALREYESPAMSGLENRERVKALAIKYVRKEKTMYTWLADARKRRKKINT